MNRTTALIASLTLASLSTASLADTNQAYYGIGYHHGSLDIQGLPETNPGGIAFRVGKYINEVIAFEGRLMLGLTDDTFTFLGADIDVELNSALSIFVKADVPMSPFVNAYGLLGYTSGEVEFTGPGGSFSEDENDLSYGFGIEGEIGRNTLLSAEYVMFLDGTDFDYTGLNFGITTRF